MKGRRSRHTIKVSVGVLLQEQAAKLDYFSKISDLNSQVFDAVILEASQTNNTGQQQLIWDRRTEGIFMDDSVLLKKCGMVVILEECGKVLCSS